MKNKIVFILSSLLLIGCSDALVSSNTISSISSELDSSSELNTSLSLSSSINVTSSNEKSSSSISIKSESSISANKLPVPLNKDNKIILPSQQAKVFNFENSTMPEYFRGIYGNNFVEEYYASGNLKIDSDNEAKKGFQTAMFVTEKKLEIRLKIGEMHGKQNSKFDKNKHVLQIDGLDENGNLVQTYEIENDKFISNKGNYSIKCYLYPATTISYLEVRAVQLPYISNKSYNFAFSGIELISWPYDL